MTGGVAPSPPLRTALLVTVCIGDGSGNCATLTFTSRPQGQRKSRSCDGVYMNVHHASLLLIAQVVFLLQRRHTQTNKATDATDYRTHASVSAGMGNSMIMNNNNNNNNLSKTASA